MPPDPQTLLQQPMWTTALQFIHSPHNNSNGSSTNYDSNENKSYTNLLASGTAYKQVQIYDIRTSSSSSTDSAQNSITRRPVLHTPENLLQHRVTSLLQLPNTNHLVVADAIGDCHILDLRKFHTGKQCSYNKRKQTYAAQEIGLGRLVGPGGSIRQLAIHPTLPMVACVGLDRKLWTWDVNTKRMIDCVYLRQRLNCLLVCDDEGWDSTATGGDDEQGILTESGDWENETDCVQDYVDSDDDNNDEKTSDSESSSEETESSEENNEVPGEETSSDDSDDKEEDVNASKLDKPKKKRRING